MQPAIKYINNKTSNKRNKKLAYKKLFDSLYEILVSTKIEVDKLLEARVKAGEIKDINQARKSIAGNAFSSFIGLCILKKQRA